MKRCSWVRRGFRVRKDADVGMVPVVVTGALAAISFVLHVVAIVLGGA